MGCGRRLSSGDTAETGESETMRQVVAYIEHDGLPFLKDVQTPVDFALRASLICEASTTLVMEKRAYAFVLAGHHDEALEELDELYKLETNDPHEVWPDDSAARAERAARVRAALTEDADQGVAILTGWRNATLERVGLAEYAWGDEAKGARSVV
jgi:hypothetical protein